MNSRILLALATFVVSSAAAARKLPNYDALESTAPRAARSTSARGAAIAQLARPGAPVHLDDRFGVPHFLWASKQASANALSGLRAGNSSFSASGMESAQAAARAHLGAFAPAYGLSSFDVDSAFVAHVHDIGRGPVIVQFEQLVDGLEVFRERARVIMDRSHELIALSGHISGTSADSFAVQSSFQLGAADAVASAFSDLSGNLIEASAMQSFGALEGGYESFDLTPGVKRAVQGATTQPARAKPLWFHGADGLQPAYYVEVDSANGGGSDSFGYVISAVDGSVLFRNDLTADAEPNSYTYRVWAADPSDPKNPSAPFDGPQGNSFDPHPTGTMDGTQPPGAVPQADVTLVSSPYAADPWLPIGALETTGNNVDSYADIGGADGFTAGIDFRAGVTGPNAFQYTYDVTQPNTVNTMKAALVQMFYNVNFWHDWYYRSGFTESAGNAQTNNYGRGGVAGDNIRAEGQDFSGRNNANMNTPADGGRPRMQMFLFDGVAARHLLVTGGTGLVADYSTGVPSGWGISSHDVSGEVAWLTDGVGSTVYPPATTVTATIHDGCDYTPGAGGAVDPRWANVTGKIAFVDRGGTSATQPTCGFSDKAFNAQRAGALGVIIASTTPHGAPSAIAMGPATTPPPVVTIPVYQMSTPNGDAFRAALTSGTVTVRMLRDPAVDRDGTVDDQIMAHEWGHYISNRLVQNSAGLTTNTARGMGEGWADFHAMLLTVKEEDSAVPSNLAYNGVYALSVWVTTGGTNGPNPNQGAYFGIRRMPYSTDLTRNSMTYRNIQDSSAVPVGVPFSFWPAPGTTAVNGGNSEVHNTGEVWATMLWECYASMLRRTVGPNADLTFSQARERMKDILVAAYKATPGQPTFLEARDAVLAAAYATDMTDYRNFVAAFAKRGAGIGAVSPDRYSGTNNGAVESFSIGTDMAFVGATIVDDVSSCDRDNVLDSGETAHLNVTLRNDSSQNLFATTAAVSSTNPNISFPSGTLISFPASAPRETVVGSVVVAMAAGLTGIQPYEIQVTYGDPALLVPTNNATWSANGNVDDLTAQAQGDGFESNTLVWTTITVGQLSGLTGWTRNTLSLLDHNMKVADQNGTTDLSLVSPTMLVGAGPFSLSFQHRYGFEFSGTTFFDGGVVEITTDNGVSWTDIGSLAAATGNRYGGTLAAGGNPLGPRPAFVATSAGYPAYLTTTINLGTTYAGKSVKVRFRAGSDNNGVANGWEVDNVGFTGLATRPFPALLANKCASGIANRKPSVTAVAGATTVAERSAATLTFTATDADGDPLQFSFTQTTGTPVTLTSTPIDATHASVSFTAPEVPVGNGSLQIAAQAFDGTAWSGTGTVTITVTNVDRPPVASAGASQTVPERSLVTLNGAGSSDPDGDALTYQWTQTAGPSATLSSATGPSPTFAAPEVSRAGATLTFGLTVTALGVASAPSTVNVSVVDVNRGPTVDAGPAQVVDERSLVQLHAAATDPDGDALTFTWTQISPASPAVPLAPTNEPTFLAPEVTSDTTFTFQVTASDGLASAQATVSVTVRNVNLAPVAIASAAAAAVDERSSVTLDGTHSFDPDSSTPLAYRWTVDPATPLPVGATLTNGAQALATFNTGEVASDTAVTFHLVVNDGTLDSAAAALTLIVRDLNRAPVAVITGFAGAMARTLVTLSGTSSSDPDGSPLHYAWVQTAGPGVVLNGANTATMSFVAPDVKGDVSLGFQLVVDDGALVSRPATASVIVRKHKGRNGEDDLVLSSVAQVSGGCASAQTSSFAPILLVFAFGLLRRRRASA